MAFALEYFLGTAPCTRQENYEISTRYVIMNENLKKIQTNISAQLSSLLAVLELLEGTSMTGAGGVRRYDPDFRRQHQFIRATA